jgi:hypothetical protein
MNSEKALINRIKTLREIAPDNDWVVSCKTRIMGPEAMAQKARRWWFCAALFLNIAWG